MNRDVVEAAVVCGLLVAALLLLAYAFIPDDICERQARFLTAHQLRACGIGEPLP